MSEFDEYIRQGEPGRSEKAAAWQAAIGLQDVDGLQPSAYLVDTAKRHIEGDITIDQVKGLIDSYYKSRQGRLSAEEERTEEAIRHIASFIAGIWQIHPFGEGNTRTTAVFLIKYLRSFGFAINNDLFAAHSWYFRNALVRANYSNRDKSISYDLSYLECFLRNLVLGESHVLKNHHLHISYQSDGASVSKGQIGTLSVTLEERAVLNCISKYYLFIQKDIDAAIGISVWTV